MYSLVDVFFVPYHAFSFLGESHLGCYYARTRRFAKRFALGAFFGPKPVLAFSRSTFPASRLSCAVAGDLAALLASFPRRAAGGRAAFAAVRLGGHRLAHGMRHRA
eukprot:3593529-Pleurochrysis_carterae.AAC.2